MFAKISLKLLETVLWRDFSVTLALCCVLTCSHPVCLLLPLPFLDHLNLVSFRAQYLIPCLSVFSPWCCLPCSVFCLQPWLLLYVVAYPTSPARGWARNSNLVYSFTHTHSWRASQSLHQPTDYHIPLDDNSTCWAAQTRLNYYRLPHQKTLPVLPSKWTLILTSFYCYVLLPTLQFLVQHCKGPCLHYIFREPSSLSTVAKMILHNYVGINFYSLQKPPRCLTHSKWKPNSLLWSYIVYTWLFFHTVSSASFCYLF